MSFRKDMLIACKNCGEKTPVELELKDSGATTTTFHCEKCDTINCVYVKISVRNSFPALDTERRIK